MDNVLEFNRKKVEEVKKQRTTAEKIKDLDGEVKHMELQREILKTYGPDVFKEQEADEKKRNKHYMGTMQAINAKVTELRLEMKKLAKELELP
jgi:chromosome segregation ATPase